MVRHATSCASQVLTKRAIPKRYPAYALSIDTSRLTAIYWSHLVLAGRCLCLGFVILIGPFALVLALPLFIVLEVINEDASLNHSLLAIQEADVGHVRVPVGVGVLGGFLPGIVLFQFEPQEEFVEEEVLVFLVPEFSRETLEKGVIRKLEGLLDHTLGLEGVLNGLALVSQ